MINHIILRTYKRIFSCFLLCMIQSKQSHRHSIIMLCVSRVALFAYPMKLNVSTKNTVTRILQKKLYSEFKLSFQCNQENT